MLTQLDDDGWKFVVVYANQSNNKIKANYNSYARECLAIVWAVFFVQCYLYDSPFILDLDH
jgi:hypothetical protein